MNKPYLVVVTGRPGAGKTTFSRILGEKLFMPVISRDQIKEGYVQSFGKSHANLPPETNGIVTKIFFDTLHLFAENHVSVIAEAAFQHKVWASRLEWFRERTQMSILICKVDDQVAFDRYIQRGLEDPSREYFHGDGGVAVKMSPYEEPHIEVPTFYVNTLGEYSPSVPEIASRILK